MTVPTPTVLPTQFTSDLRTWDAFYQQLGLTPTSSSVDPRHILAADSGALMLAEVEPGSALDGVRLVELAVPDLDAYRDALQTAGVRTTTVQLAHQPAVAVDLPQGRIHARELDLQQGTDDVDPAGLSIGALLYGPADQMAAGAALLGQHGLHARIASDSGGWSDLVGQGLFAFHRGTLQTVEGEAPEQPVVEVFGETGDLDQLVAGLEEHRVEASLIDEAFGRSLRVSQPDGSQLQINETQQDLYGFHRVGA